MYHYNISVTEPVRAIYAANMSDDFPPDKVSVLISDKKSAIGKYFCMMFFDDTLPRCEDVGCNIDMTYIGTPSLKNDLFSMISRLSGSSPVYVYKIDINKTDYKLVKVQATPIIE